MLITCPYCTFNCEQNLFIPSQDDDFICPSCNCEFMLDLEGEECDWDDDD